MLDGATDTGGFDTVGVSSKVLRQSHGAMDTQKMVMQRSLQEHGRTQLSLSYKACEPDTYILEGNPRTPCLPHPGFQDRKYHAPQCCSSGLELGRCTG